MTEESKTKHRFTGGGGYLSLHCILCGADEYETSTIHCEDVPAEKIEKAQKIAHTHAATEEALGLVRAAITEEQWNLLKLNQIRAYRDRDIIRI